MNSTTGGELVATAMNAESAEMGGVPGDEYALFDENKRRAHICFGCDTRNAVFAVDGIGLFYCIFMVASFWLLHSDMVYYDDDLVNTTMNGLDHWKIGLIISFFVVGMISTIVAILGAVHFHKLATCVGGIWWLGFAILRSIFFKDFTTAGIAACFCYPHLVFYHELKNGVMSRENYPKEKVCCDCCVCPR